MRRVVLLGLIACAGKPPSTPGTISPRNDKPSTSLPEPVHACLPDGESRVAVVGGAVVACAAPYDQTPERCFQVSPSHIDKAVPPPPPVPARPSSSATVGDDGTGRIAACSAGTCKPLGPAALAALAAAKQRAAQDQDSRPVQLEATDDLAIVVIDGGPWRLRADRELALVAPPSYASPKDAFMNGVDVMGTWLVTTWTTCAGPCEKAIVTDTSGRHHGGLFDAGPLLRVDDHRAAVISTQADETVTLLDIKTGKQLGQIVVGAGEPSVHAARIDDHTFAFIAGSSEVWWIDVTTSTPKLAGAVTIPRCDD